MVYLSDILFARRTRDIGRCDMSQGLEVLDQLLGGDLPLNVIAGLFPVHHPRRGKWREIVQVALPR